MGKKKTAIEKRDQGKPGKVEPIPPSWESRYGAGDLWIPSPTEIDVMIRAVPPGKVATSGQMREVLAEIHGTKITCPLVTGIYLRVCAEAAEEERANGVEPIAPYWRVVGEDGKLNDKFPGGIEAQAEQLIREGHEVRGKRVVLSAVYLFAPRS